MVNLQSHWICNMKQNPNHTHRSSANIVCTTVLAVLATAMSASCIGQTINTSCDTRNESGTPTAALRDSLQAIADSYQGEIGIAVLTDRSDTIAVNNENKYPLMSVFKLHQAISLCDMFAQSRTSLDTVLSVDRTTLNPDTWSPMLKDYSGDIISISVRDMLRYTLMQSDNNASNYLFASLQPIDEADRFTATIIPRRSFRLSVTEDDMWDNHDLCYENCSSPLGAAILINRLYTDSIIPPAGRDFICTSLEECKTGTDRIVAPLRDIKGIHVGHKTGSGFRTPDGVLTAHNDVAFVRMPDGRHYALAVLVKDFKGDEAEAAKAIARISASVYSAVTSLYR